jgi:Tfp pilus assembly protein PilP
MCIVTLPACQKQKDAKQAVSQFLKQIETTTTAERTKNLSDQAAGIHITYEGENLRNPFELPAMVKNLKFYPNTILKDAGLDSLKLVGIVLHKNQQWAVFRAQDKKLYKMTVGMRVGFQQALLSEINQDNVKFTVDTQDGSKRKVEMVLEEQKKS